MVEATTPGYITAGQCSELQPGPQSRSNGNYGIGTAISNLSVIQLDPDRRFCVYNSSSTHLVADVQGFFGPTGPNAQMLVPTTPTRLLDTRVAPLSRPTAGSITRVQTSAPAGSSAVLVNIAMTGRRCRWLHHRRQVQRPQTRTPNKIKRQPRSHRRDFKSLRRSHRSRRQLLYIQRRPSQPRRRHPRLVRA